MSGSWHNLKRKAGPSPRDESVSVMLATIAAGFIAAVMVAEFWPSAAQWRPVSAFGFAFNVLSIGWLVPLAVLRPPAVDMSRIGLALLAGSSVASIMVNLALNREIIYLPWPALSVESMTTLAGLIFYIAGLGHSRDD